MRYYIGLVLILLAGCAQDHGWRYRYGPSPPPGVLEKDLKECVFEACMRGRGWEKI